MQATSHQMQVRRTARYYTLGSAGADRTTVWFVLHGYGQLAHYFIQNFGSIAGEGTIVVAPEGLSRYYLDPNYQRVGASWMTKEDRLMEINDYVAYLDQLMELILEPLKGQHVTVNVLGFSQGVPTAWRWVKHGNVQPEELVFWAGNVPDEKPDEINQRLVRTRVWFAWADQDEYITPEMVGASQRMLHQLRTVVEWLPYPGRHRIENAALQELISRIRES